MSNDDRRGPNRREVLRGSLAAGGVLLIGCGDDSGAAGGDGAANDSGGGDRNLDAGPSDVGDGGTDGEGGEAGGACADRFAGGSKLGVLPFVGEGSRPAEMLTGEGLDARLCTDLTKLDADNLVTSTDAFYVRTGTPDQIDWTRPWTIALGGLVKAPATLTLDDLAPLVADQGLHLLECSGNGSGCGFGLMSVARWKGVPLGKLLERVEASPGASRILISGFDQHSKPSAGGFSKPGASWVFTPEDLIKAGAFLATHMNGAPLPKDHGFPVRLLVPGWYGCANAKWVDEVRWVGDDEPATTQMREFASRTHQPMAFALARDYLPATQDQAAMPVRVEKWRVGGAILYRLCGILWGGAAVTDALEVGFAGAKGAFTRVDVCPKHAASDPWTLWTHAWSPPAAGTYEIRLRIADPMVRQRRLDTGFYARTVTIDEV